MSLEEIVLLPEGPRRTAAIASWVQGLFRKEVHVPILVRGTAVEILTGGALEALRAFDAEWTDGDSDPEALELWANKGPQESSS